LGPRPESGPVPLGSRSAKPLPVGGRGGAIAESCEISGVFPIKLPLQHADASAVEVHRTPEEHPDPSAASAPPDPTASRGRTFVSLPSQMTLSVLVATLVTSLLVTLLSTRSIGAFLKGEIDRKFPAILLEVDQRLAQWFEQRERDVETFGQSRVVVDSFRVLATNATGRESAAARGELRDYLRYVLARFPQYQSLFVLDETGEVLVWVGAEQPLPPRFRRDLTRINGPALSSAQPTERELLQVVSAPKTRAGPSLHALLQRDAFQGLLASDDLGVTGSVFLVDAAGSVLLGTRTADAGRLYERALPLPDSDMAIEEYARADGGHAVGSAKRFGRFGWTIVVEEDYDAAFAPVVRVVRQLLVFNLAIVAVFSTIAYGISRSIVRPILLLSDRAFRIARGDADVVIPRSNRRDEIGVLTRTFREMMNRLRLNQDELEEKRVEIEDANHRLLAQNRELQRVNEVFEQLSITDDLTKLHNHRFFQEQLPREMKRSDRTGDPLALILIDVDDFKQVNDLHGHSVGDAVLRRVAEVMGREVRDMDLLARYGGEEFALLASGTNRDGAVALAEKLRLAVADSRFSLLAPGGPSEIRVTVSSGVALYRGDARAFFNEADRALYRAKEAGKDCVVVADGDDHPSRSSDV